MEVQIQLNGAARGVPRDSSVAELVAALGLVPEQVAVELNRDLVPRERRADTRLREGDRVELVTLVGGG